MKFKVVTLFPDLIQSIVSAGVLGQAKQKGLVEVECVNPRDVTSDVHKTVDDRPFGGGDGMIMLAEPLTKTLEKINAEMPEAYVVYMSPQGRTLSQNKVIELSRNKNLVLICGRYGGIDQRVINYFIDEEISIGDYVLSGGELAAGVLIDSVARQIPGVLGHAQSAEADSFSLGLNGLLEAPLFTRPREFMGEAVPEILTGGHHAKIQEWKESVSILVTLLKRPDLVKTVSLSAKEIQRVQKFWSNLSISEKEVLGLATLDSQLVEGLNQ